MKKKIIPRVLIFATHEDYLLLLKGSSSKQNWPNLYNGIGGHVEQGEGIFETVKREFFEDHIKVLKGVTLGEFLGVDKKETICKGLYWCASTSYYISVHNSIESRKSLRLLKKKSCPGCAKCEWVFGFLNEQMDEYDPLEEIEHGKLYTYNVASSTEWETGYTEIDYIDFKEVKEKQDGSN